MNQLPGPPSPRTRIAEPDGGEGPGLQIEPGVELQRQTLRQRDPQGSDDVRKADRPLAGVLIGGDRVGVLDRKTETVAPPEAQGRRDRPAVAPEALELAPDTEATSPPELDPSAMRRRLIVRDAH